MDSWKKAHNLGAGTYGTVYLAEKFNPHLSIATAAVKSAAISHSTSLKIEGDILFELRGCREIVQCFGEDISYENNRKVYNLLLEYASGGSLADLIKKSAGNMPESLVACYSYMLLKGLSHVHEKGYVHCDIKPSNILVFPSTDGSNVHNLKIADFGLATKIGNDKILPSERSINIRGTLRYSSPESIVKGKNKPVSDIWSLGCTIVEMITGKLIWSTAGSKEEIIQEIAFGNPIPENISDIAKDFLNKCFEKYHGDRWTADMLLDHPFIVKNLKALPPNFNDRVLLSRTNPFSTGIWASELNLFTTRPEQEKPTASCNIVSRLLCAPRKNENVRGQILLPYQQCAPIKNQNVGAQILPPYQQCTPIKNQNVRGPLCAPGKNQNVRGPILLPHRLCAPGKNQNVRGPNVHGPILLPHQLCAPSKNQNVRGPILLPYQLCAPTKNQNARDQLLLPHQLCQPHKKVQNAI
ncbi:mitogen-activated kinase kinase kinase NPK1-like [Olea europaea subsp. europaea]|uniref:Mitogen-activated kinase kinase kinase NPK1-like n=1 Tax=Olea europaea subsp. europaea TaxID=158383 RepID=A0A8S0U300_OLEEU|nr:mitogen-activated kinase kinase kinase NPK1-like [Olea europaea subsp. europaea]